MNSSTILRIGSNLPGVVTIEAAGDGFVQVLLERVNGQAATNGDDDRKPRKPGRPRKADGEPQKLGDTDAWSALDDETRRRVSRKLSNRRHAAKAKGDEATLAKLRKMTAAEFFEREELPGSKVAAVG